GHPWARTRQPATSSECRSRWLLVRDLNPRIRAERNLARNAWRFMKTTEGGLKQFANRRLWPCSGSISPATAAIGLVMDASADTAPSGIGVSFVESSWPYPL